MRRTAGGGSLICPILVILTGLARSLIHAWISSSSAVHANRSSYSSPLNRAYSNGSRPKIAQNSRTSSQWGVHPPKLRYSHPLDCDNSPSSFQSESLISIIAKSAKHSASSWPSVTRAVGLRCLWISCSANEEGICPDKLLSSSSSKPAREAPS